MQNSDSKGHAAMDFQQRTLKGSEKRFGFHDQHPIRVHKCKIGNFLQGEIKFLFSSYKVFSASLMRETTQVDRIELTSGHLEPGECEQLETRY